MSYNPTTWIEKVTKVGPTNMNKLELGLQAAAAVADSASAVAAAALPTPAGSDGQFLQRVGGLWVPHTLVAADIPTLAASKISGGVAMQVIDDLTVTGSVLATYDTNTRLGGNIPATYKDLVLVVKGKADVAANLQMRLNNSSAASYYYEVLEATAAAPASAEGLAQTQFLVGNSFGAGAGIGNLSEITIPNYADATFGPNFRADYWHSTGTGTGNLRKGQSGGAFNVTGAVTRLALLLSGGNNFAIGTRFTLYGRG